MPGWQDGAGRLIGEDIQLSVVPSGETCRANLDPSQLQRALMNLAANARDAMPDGGHLTIRTECKVLRARAARALEVESGEYAVLSVTDTGVGMDGRTRQRAFDPFFTSKPTGAGAGLGLAVVYGFARQSGGAIELESRPGKGSTFRLYFPFVAYEPAPAPPAQQPEALPRGAGTILVVEDEPSLRRLLAMSLQDAGYTVLATESPTKAVPLARGHAGSIDLLVTDLVMPGMSGVDLARHVREAFPGVAVLSISGYTGKELLRRRLGDGEGDILPKPFREEQLLRHVRDALAKAGKKPAAPGRGPKNP